MSQRLNGKQFHQDQVSSEQSIVNYLADVRGQRSKLVWSPAQDKKLFCILLNAKLITFMRLLSATTNFYKLRFTTWHMAECSFRIPDVHIMLKTDLPTWFLCKLFFSIFLGRMAAHEGDTKPKANTAWVANTSKWCHKNKKNLILTKILFK